MRNILGRHLRENFNQKIPPGTSPAQHNRHIYHATQNTCCATCVIPPTTAGCLALRKSPVRERVKGRFRQQHLCPCFQMLKHVFEALPSGCRAAREQGAVRRVWLNSWQGRILGCLVMSSRESSHCGPPRQALDNARPAYRFHSACAEPG